MEYILIDYKGRVYREFFVSKDPGLAPGWFVYGRCRNEYGPNGIIFLVGRPAVKPRKHPHYNVKIRRGWHSKREAQAYADQLNRQYPLGEES